jgi:hypothetical protein
MSELAAAAIPRYAQRGALVLQRGDSLWIGS